MKFIGHVSTAVIIASPLIYFRGSLPDAFQGDGMSTYDLLWWTAFFGILPDIDILLSRWTAIKHRGMTTHSLYTVLVATGLLVGGWLMVGSHLIFLNPLTAVLTFVALSCHLVGDSLTKTGIPLVAPNQGWNFPVVGGHVAFDSYWLNAIPLFVAGYILYAAFEVDANALRGLGRWRHAGSYFRKFVQ